MTPLCLSTGDAALTAKVEQLIATLKKRQSRDARRVPAWACLRRPRPSESDE